MILLAVLALAASDPGLSAETSRVERGVRLGASLVQRLPDDFEDTDRIGTGLWAAYEYRVSSSTALGIHLGGRFFSGDQRVWQIGYGLTLRHNFRWEGPVEPYLIYGLLVQSTVLEDSSSYTTSHNTMLGAGIEGRQLLDGIFLQASYNLSRLRFFDVETQNASFLEFTAGYHWRF